MISKSIVHALRRADRPTAIVLGLNEIASAIAVRVHRMGYGVVMSHDPNPPVIRRGMAFFDALYGDLTALGGLTAVSIDTTLAARAQVLAHEHIAVTRLGLPELLALGEIGVLIDARMQKRVVRPDLRHLARMAIGLGPGFTVGENCDVAVETRPGHEGIVQERRTTEAADGVCRELGGRGRERFVYSEEAGRWHTALDVGTRIFKGFPLGRLGERVIAAPMDGLLRGIARDDIDVPAGVKVIEIDTRGRRAQWVGMDERGRLLAEVTCRALAQVGPEADLRGRRLRLVHSQ